MPRTIRYIRDPAFGLEAVLCLGSGIAYPLHSHVSVYAAGLVLGGAVQLAVGPAQRVLRQGEGFLIPPDLTAAAGTPRKADPPVEALRRRLEQRPEQKLSLDEMARAACLSKYHLIRVFRRQTGLTPHQFQLQNRVRRAQRLLAAGPDALPAAEAALAAGFCDQSHLVRCFERLVGLSPRAYRAACVCLQSAPFK